MPLDFEMLELGGIMQRGFLIPTIRPANFADRPFVEKRFHEMAKEVGAPDALLCVGHCSALQSLTSESQKHPPYVVLSDIMVKTFSDRELVAVAGHELGHVKQNKKTKPFVSHKTGTGCGAVIGAFAAAKYIDGQTSDKGTSLRQMPRREMLKTLGLGLLAVGTGAGGGYTAGNHADVIEGLALEMRADDYGIVLSKDKEAFISALHKVEEWVVRYTPENEAQLQELRARQHRLQTQEQQKGR